MSDRDVSKSKCCREELLAMQQRFEVMLETITDVFWAMDLDGQFTDRLQMRKDMPNAARR